MRTIIPTTFTGSVEAAERLNFLVNRKSAVSDIDYDEHYRFVSSTADMLQGKDINTRTAFASRLAKHDWVYDDDRAVKHQEIISEVTASWVDVPKNREAVLTGGLIGSGKTTVLRKHSNLVLDDYVFLSADLMKIRFIEKGLIPSLGGFLPLEASILAYKETNHVVWQLFELAYREGYNLIFDTMMGAVDATLGKINPLHNVGYVVDGIFVDVSIETALRRTKNRHRLGFERFVLSGGKTFGGRLLPEVSITEQTVSSASSHNFVVFQEVSPLFRGTQIFDNNIDGSVPVRVS